MTSKQRSQYMALSVVEGFVFEARKLPLEQKTKKSLKRTINQVIKMKELLGPVNIIDGRHILNKHDRVTALLQGQPGELFAMDYLNAVQMMVNIMQDSIPCRDTQREWGRLEGMLFTAHMHFEELSEINCLRSANEFGKDLTLAVMS